MVKPLLESEVPMRLQSFLDFNSQAVETRWKNMRITVTCPRCARERRYFVNAIRQALRKGEYTGRCASCSRQMHSPVMPSGPDNPNWQGGQLTEKDGYVITNKSLLSPEEQTLFGAMFGARRYIFEHRLVMARALNRALLENEHVHHINKKRGDNRLENLRLVTHHGEPICPRCRWPLDV